jgi:predicted nucleic acid-binding protein
LRIVLETNVVLSPLLRRGPPHRVFEVARQQERFRLFTGTVLPEEPAAAATADADLVVSGDRHLLGLGSHQGIAIRTPAEALAIIAP